MTRQCDLASTGALEETIREWEPQAKLAISIESTRKMPIKHGPVTFGLAGADAGPTTVTVDYEYEGMLGGLMGGMPDRKFTKGFTGLLKDLDAASTSSA